METDKTRIIQLESELEELRSRMDYVYRALGLTGDEEQDELRQRVTIPAPAPKG